MKKLIVIALITLFSQTAVAETLLRFKDGSANVWSNIYIKGDSYCTRKAYGNTEICAAKKDVVLKKEVPTGSDPSDYGDGSTAGLQGQSDNMWAAGQDDKADQANVSRRNAEIDQRAKKAARADRKAEDDRRIKWQSQSENTKR